MHDTRMDIPIRNSLFDNTFFLHKKNNFHLPSNISLDFNEKDLSQFEILKTGYRILRQGHRSWILFNVINDILVNKFLNKEIFFYEIVKNLIKIFNTKKINSYTKNKVKNFNDIKKIIKYGKEITEKIKC
jgi:1-deoxy-D-xylulose 5-phosphate reductoisomerase